MTRKKALAKVLQKYGDEFSVMQIMAIKEALNWYGEDDIIDDQWDEHVAGIVEMYSSWCDLKLSINND